ncbi:MULTISPECIES: hypothetical protein [Citrobacter]|nr:hypothetical protein [Citrobacter braakii]WAD30710.1 hypothetical protein MKJ05_21375 [Citrobacter braakii]
MMKSPERNLYAVKNLLGHVSWDTLMKVLMACGIYWKPN